MMSMSDTEVEHAKNRSDKKVVSGEYVECPRCGHDEKVITYYDSLAPDRTCTNCRYTS